MQPNLEKFIIAALEKKISREEIKSVLLKAGWSADEVNSGLKEFAETDFAIPVPARKPYLSARETFMHLLTFLCLYLSAISFGMIIFFFINRAFPDALNQYELTSEVIRTPMSMIIIAFPIFFGLTIIDQKNIKTNPTAAYSKIRKWLTYITLFFASAIIIVSLITLIYNLLGGEITVRFLLKMATVMGITLCVFGYYFTILKRDEKPI